MASNGITLITHRFLESAGDPSLRLAPIAGFNKYPLVILEVATEPLQKIVPGLKTMVHVVKHQARNPADNLSIDQSAAIALYTMEWPSYTDSLYHILNTALRTKDRKILKPWFLYLKLLFTALDRLPPVTCTIYRGIRCEYKNEHEKYDIGSEGIWWGFSSCSTEREISETDQFLGQNGQSILFIITCIKGKDISQHSYFRKENEVLLLPATEFKVTGREHHGNGLHVICLKQIESSYTFLEPVSPEQITPTDNKSIISDAVSEAGSTAMAPEGYLNVKLNKFIAGHKSHANVYLNGKHYNQYDMRIIARQLIIDRKCPGLYLTETEMTSREATAIFDALDNSNNTLERLFLSQNKLGDEGTRVLAKALSARQNLVLKELCLSGNGITDEGIEHLAIMLESNSTLTHLWLAKNEIRERGLQRLAEVLGSKNKTLKLLSLERNNFHSDTSVNILLDLLKSSQSLTTLNLDNCKLSRSAIRQLKDAVPKTRIFKLSIT